MAAAMELIAAPEKPPPATPFPQVGSAQLIALKQLAAIIDTTTTGNTTEDDNVPLTLSPSQGHLEHKVTFLATLNDHLPEPSDRSIFCNCISESQRDSNMNNMRDRHASHTQLPHRFLVNRRFRGLIPGKVSRFPFPCSGIINPGR